MVVGSGPAGLFCALILAEAGLKPIVIERGKPVDQRLKDVEDFFLLQKKLNTESNIQFGEGGAGTFSDGKINTGVKDKMHRIIKIVDTFIEMGAPEEIRYMSKPPHIGTDYLINVVKGIRNRIIELGGHVRFATKMTGLEYDSIGLSGVTLNHEGNDERLETNNLVLALGHSARDTFEALVRQNVPMTQKAFAVGLRIEHPQNIISKSQYGDGYKHKSLPVADYKLTYRTCKGRGVYTFCMCPGGFVVNAASEEGRVVCNGMSNFKRDEVNANSAVLVNVHTDDFDSDDVLAGMEFQRKWESLAFDIGGGADYTLPIQRFGDYEKSVASTTLGKIKPNIKGHYKLSNLNDCLPEFVNEALLEGIHAFGRKIKGFNNGDAILTGVETRSSSPVRMDRDENYMSPIAGLYPCGEGGAGYAGGGIMSAALDGIKVAESIIKSL